MKQKTKAIMLGLATLAISACQTVRTFTEYADLNNNGWKEEIEICYHSDGDCSIQINELNRVRAGTRGIFFGEGYLYYDNLFYRKSPIFFKMPINPQSIGFRDTNEDGYLDFVFHSQTNEGLESYVMEQTGDGGILPPKKLDIHGYIDLDNAISLYERGLNMGSRGDYDAAIHFAERSLDYLNPENPYHHKTLFKVYGTLGKFYENNGNEEKAKEIENKILSLEFIRGKI